MVVNQQLSEWECYFFQYIQQSCIWCSIKEESQFSLDVKNYLWFWFPTDPIFSRWLRAAHTACQNGVCCHTNYWTKLPKFVHRKYASLVNIDVGTLLQIAQQKTAKTMKKIFKKKFISDLPTLIFSRYETGTTGIFFYALVLLLLWVSMCEKLTTISCPAMLSKTHQCLYISYLMVIVFIWVLMKHNKWIMI
jgi:hypothetical protein